MKSFYNYLVLAGVVLTSSSAFAEPVDLYSRLARKDAYYLEFGDVVRQMSDTTFLNALSEWTAQRGTDGAHRKYMERFRVEMSDIIQSPRVLDMLAYSIKTEQTELTATLVRFYYAEKLNFVHELSDDPLLSDAERRTAAAFFAAQQDVDVSSVAATFAGLKVRGASSFFSDLGDAISEAKKLNGGDDNAFTFDVEEEFPNYVGPYQVISHSGFVPGNDLRYFGYTIWEYDGKDYLSAIESYGDKMEAAGYYEGDDVMSVSEFRELIEAGVGAFSVDEGFADIDSHIAFREAEDNIFWELRKAIRDAKETLFIDIFFLGQSVGGAIANELIRKAEEGVKVYLVHDMWNNLGFRVEQLPASNYLRAYAELNPNLVFVSADVTQHVTGLPSFAEDLVPASFFDLFSESVGVSAESRFYPEVKSDHSKVLVADACSQGGVAIVGSKNWLDVEGAVTFDDVVRIEGPGACVVQDSYYYDLFEGLKNDTYDFFDSSALSGEEYIDLLYSRGDDAGCLEADRSCKVRAIISPLDALGRRADGGHDATSLDVESKGDAAIRIGENNHNNTITSAVDQYAHLILSAKSQITISDQYFYSEKVVEALELALTRNDRLRVYILMGDLTANWMYVDKLYAFNYVDTRVFIKLKKAEFDSALVRNTFHPKNLSIDGINLDGDKVDGQSVLVVGSANKDFLTMSGAFREMQVAVYSDEVVRRSDEIFWSRWVASDKAITAVPWNYEVPERLSSVDKGLLMTTARHVVETLYGVEVYGR